MLNAPGHLGYYNDTCAPWGRVFDSYLGYLNGNAGYYCSHYDFHECNAPAQIGAAGSPRTYFNASGKIDSGPDATGIAGGATQTVAYSKAVSLCDAAGDGCYGFTFESADPEPSTAVSVTFKQALVLNATDKNSSWHSYFSQQANPPSCNAEHYAACNYNYEGMYSTHAYATRAQNLITGWKAADPPLFVYLAWQAVHEPMTVPDSYLVPNPYCIICIHVLLSLNHGYCCSDLI